MIDLDDGATGDDHAETIVVDYDLAEPPKKVWRALTEPGLLAAWLGPNDIRPEVGHRFRLEPHSETGRVVECEVLEVEPNRSIRYSWREERDDGTALDSCVTWTLTPTFVGGTRLRLVHDGFALSSPCALPKSVMVTPTPNFRLAA